jgi:hypothetical protein
MIENVWSPFTEHIHERRVRLGFSEERLLEAYKIGGLEEALNYIAFFEANTQEESDDFKSKFRDALKQIQTKLDKRSRAEGEDVNG